MRLCFYNPHTGLIGTTVYHKLFKKTFHAKYGYLLKLLQDQQYSTAIVVDGTVSSFPIEYLTKNTLVLKIIAFFEIYIWCFIHQINPFRKTLIFSAKHLDSATDILYGFAALGSPFYDQKLTEKSIFKKFAGKKMLYMSHYFTKTGVYSNHIKSTGVFCATAEADLSTSLFFNHYYSFMKNVYILPFALRKRYVQTVDFHSRKAKCLAIGTTHDLKVDDYTRDYCLFFKTTNYHKMRRLIYENKEALAETMDSYIYPYEDMQIPNSRFYQKWLIYKYWYKLFHMEQIRYFQFDIIQKYNEYMMFVSPEEDVGLPSVNFIEGMACGCAFLGVNHHMYSDIGLVNGVHFITYDGTLKGLQKMICHYQSHLDQLEAIARNGYDYIRECFFEERVRAIFWRDLESYISLGQLKSTFVKYPKINSSLHSVSASGKDRSHPII